MGAFQNDNQIIKVIIDIAAKSTRYILKLFEIVDENRMMVDMVPGPVVNGMAIGITAVEMIFEKLGLSTLDSELSLLPLIIENPVLRSNRPPAIRKAETLISKKFRIAIPVNSEITMVRNEVNVAILQSFKRSFGASP